MSVWREVTLEELAEFRNGINFSDTSYGKGIKVIGVADFQDYLFPRYETLGEINPQGVVRQEDLLQEDDIVFVRSNGNRALIGRSLYISNLPCDVTHSGFTIRLRFTSSEVNPLFFAHLFKSPLMRRALSEHGSGTNISNLSQQMLRDILVPLPPLPEQRAIAAILSTWDEAITLTERLIAALQTRKRGLMQRLLTGEVRFPEFEEEWETAVIGKISELTAGGTPSTHVPEYWNGHIRWMKSGEIHLKRIAEVEGRITQAGLENSNARMLPMNSVLIALAGQGKTRGTVAINEVELSTNQSVAAIIPDPEHLYHEYLFFNLDSRYEELRRLSTGDGGRGGLNLQILSRVRIPLPSLDEQMRISEVLANCDTEIGILISHTEQLKMQKKGLMQRLLTGEIRI